MNYVSNVVLMKIFSLQEKRGGNEMGKRGERGNGGSEVKNKSKAIVAKKDMERRSAKIRSLCSKKLSLISKAV